MTLLRSDRIPCGNSDGDALVNVSLTPPPTPLATSFTISFTPAPVEEPPQLPIKGGGAFQRLRVPPPPHFSPAGR